MSNSRAGHVDPGDRAESDDAVDPAAHLADVPDGAGCTLVWERTSDHRASD